MDFDEIIDIKSAEERFLGNFELFSKFLFQFPDKSLFTELMEYMSSGDVKKSFETAHTIKGVAGNLSLKAMEKPLHEVVEELRAGRMPSTELMDKLTESYEITIKGIEKLKEDDKKLF